MAEDRTRGGEAGRGLELACGELMPGCPTVIRGESEDDVLYKAAEHARQAHDVEAWSGEQIQEARSRIRSR